MKINLNTKNGFGLGDYLCMISTWCDVPEQVELHANNREQQYDRIKQLLTIFEIPESKIKLVFNEEELGTFSGAWHTKIFSDYYYPEYVNIHGNRIKVKDDTRKRMTIGLACYNGLDFFLNSDYDVIRGSNTNTGNKSTRLPECKFRNIEFYSKMFELCRRFGYDVVTLDHPGNLEQKIQYMIENCDAVIAYEGGIAHLCHMLQIPCIMLNWRDPNVETFYGEFQVEYIHRSKTMYLIRDDAELLNMTKDQFIHIVNGLRFSQRTNNRLVTGEVRLQFTKGANSKIDFVDIHNRVILRSKIGPQISKSAQEFIEHYYKDKFQYL